MTSKGFNTSQLIESIRAGRVSGVIDALESGADIEEADMHGTSGLPLRAACFEGNEAIVRELLAHGANPNAAASDGPGAPLRLALRRGHKEIAALLLQQGAQIPEGLEIDPSVFILEVAPLPGEMTAPLLPDGEANNIIEFTRTEAHLVTEDRDTTETFGTNTNALSMDLLFLDEQDALLDFTDKDSPVGPGKPPAA